MTRFWRNISRSLKHRNYRLFFFGQGISLIGTWLTRVATGWLVYRLTHSAWMLGLANFASLAPTFLFSPVAGVMADRWNKPRALIYTQIAAAVQSAVLAVLTISDQVTMNEILALAIIQGLINAFDFPIRQSMVGHMVDDKADLPNAIALNSTMVNLARLIGPSFAGILIAASGEGGCFAVDAVSYLAVIVTLTQMRFPHVTIARAKNKVSTELREGLTYARKSRAIYSIILLQGSLSFFGVPYMTLLPMIAASQLGGDAKTLGLLTGASGLGAVIGALMLASRRTARGLAKTVAIAGLLFGLGLICFGYANGAAFALAMMLITGFGMMVHVSASNTVLQTIVEESKRGRILSLFVMAYAGMTPFGSLLGGWIADRLGAAVTLEVGGVICVFSVVAFTRFIKDVANDIDHVLNEREVAQAKLVS